MFETAKALQVDSNQKKRLRFLVRSVKTRQKVVRRARIVLQASDGVANAIAFQLGISRPTVLLWRDRFQRLGVPCLLQDAKRTGRQKALAPE